MKTKIDSLNLQPVYVAGPTASGKSDFAYFLAERFDSVVISADSMQIYRGLDVGTAKDSAEIRAKYDCKMVDIVPASASFSVAEYADAAKKHVEDALQNGKLPIIVGGTGLYFEALLYPMSFGNSSKNSEFRAEYEQLLVQKGAEYLHQELQRVDPVSAAKLFPNDTKRVIRALEIYRATGRPRNDFDDAKPSINPIMVAFDAPNRDELYARINARVDKMFAMGLVDEVLGVGSFDYQSMQAIGYKEFAAYDGTSSSLSQIKDQIKQNSRHYAKRQLTWFRRYPFIKWFNLGDRDGAAQYVCARLGVNLD